MSDFKNQFDEMMEVINNRRLQLATFKERLKNEEGILIDIKEKLKELNITSEEAEEVLSKLEKDIREELEACQKKLS